MVTHPLRIVGIAGSLRRGSFNARLLKAASQLVPDGVELEILSLEGVPLYNQDIDSDVLRPEAVDRLGRTIDAADALLIVTPEYNFGVPGVLKNALDWLSRPIDGKRVMRMKPVGMMGASPGLSGTMRAQESLKLTLLGMGSQVFPHGGVAVTQAAKKLPESGGVADEATESFLSRYLAGMIEWARRMGEPVREEASA